ncbi:MAG: DUF5666 domain-containing protein [Rhizobacter sp.]|nr:DUF5666 domain-containing protein [Rhizobacter sp.]
MKTLTHSAGRTSVATGTWRLLVGALALATAALVGACGGGGGGVAGVGSGGTGSFSVGTITGFGSIFVNGIRYEDNGARLVDDDGTVKVLGTDDNPLKLGMVVEVNGIVDDSGTVRSATQIAYGAEIKGPVTAVDAAAGTFRVFGVTVRTTSTTVYEDIAGVASLAAGNVVEVYGLPDSAGRIVATHVEREAASEAAYAADGGTYRLRGPVDGLLASSSGSTFALRGVAIRTDASTQFDGTPTEGASVSVRLNPTLQSDGRYLAQRVKVRSASFDDLPSSAEAEIEGYVSDLDASAGTLSVAGYPVRLAANVAYEDGTAADLKNGVRIEAKGSVTNGVLVAARIEFESLDDDDDGDDHEVPGGLPEFEFKGTAACIECGARHLHGEGCHLSYDAGTEFRGWPEWHDARRQDSRGKGRECSRRPAPPIGPPGSSSTIDCPANLS